MPDLDVSDILLDPDFAEMITVNRTAQTVGNDGIVVATPTPQQIVAVVTIGALKGVIRTEDYEYGNNIITVSESLASTNTAGILYISIASSLTTEDPSYCSIIVIR